MQDYTPVCTTELGEVSCRRCRLTCHSYPCMLGRQLSASHTCTFEYAACACMGIATRSSFMSVPFSAHLRDLRCDVCRLAGSQVRQSTVAQPNDEMRVLRRVWPARAVPCVAAGASGCRGMTCIRGYMGAGEFSKRGVKVLALSSNDSHSHQGCGTTRVEPRAPSSAPAFSAQRMLRRIAEHVLV